MDIHDNVEDAVRGGNAERLRILLCEGAGDAAFFKHLIEQRQLPKFEIVYPKSDEKDVSAQKPPGGRPGFSRRLQELALEYGKYGSHRYSTIKGMLIVSDNDSDPTKSFGEVCGQIRTAGAGYSVPAEPLILVRQSDFLPTIVMMIPWTNKNGKPEQVQGQFETLCLEAAGRDSKKLIDCVEELRVCSGVDTWPERKQEKMRLRVLMASTFKSDPNTGLQFAWSREEKPIPLDHSCFNLIEQVLRKFDDMVDSV